jgi:uncharacterized protein YpmS
MFKIKTLLIILLLFGTSLACNLGASTPQPTQTIAVSTEALGSLLDKIEAAAQQVQRGGEVELTLNESEVTSFFSFGMADSGSQPVSDIQVFLREGQVRVNGAYQDSGLSLPLSIVAQPEVSAGGDLRFVLVSARLGPVSAPDVLRNEIQTMLDRQLTQGLTSQAGGDIKVSSVTIADGIITITGVAP